MLRDPKPDAPEEIQDDALKEAQGTGVTIRSWDYQTKQAIDDTDTTTTSRFNGTYLVSKTTHRPK